MTHEQWAAVGITWALLLFGFGAIAKALENVCEVLRDVLDAIHDQDPKERYDV